MCLEDKWEGLCDGLGLASNASDVIKRDNTDCRSRLKAVIKKWLSKGYDFEQYGHPSWRSLVKAVADPIGCDDNAAAIKIAEKHYGEYSSQCEGL